MNKEDIINHIYSINSLYAQQGLVKNYSKSWLTKHLDKDLLFYIEKNNVILAFICGHSFLKLPRHINIAIIGVHPSYIRQGYGTKILKLFCDKFKDKIKILNVKENNKKAINFYKKIGFKIILNKDSLWLMEINKYNE